MGGTRFIFESIQLFSLDGNVDFRRRYLRYPAEGQANELNGLSPPGAGDEKISVRCPDDGEVGILSRPILESPEDLEVLAVDADCLRSGER